MNDKMIVDDDQPTRVLMDGLAYIDDHYNKKAIKKEVHNLIEQGKSIVHNYPNTKKQ